VGPLQGVVELPLALSASQPPSLILRDRSGQTATRLETGETRVAKPGRIAIEPTGPAPQLIDVTITVE
jgi:hypothetical protein